MGVKRRVWLVPVPGVGMPGVVLGSFLWWRRVLYRDLNGKCYKSWTMTELIERMN